MFVRKNYINLYIERDMNKTDPTSALKSHNGSENFDFSFKISTITKSFCATY